MTVIADPHPRIEALPARLRALLDAEIPRFSGDEMRRRRAATEAAMSERGIRHLIVYGAQRAGSASQWLTEWPTSTEVIVLVTPGEPFKVYIQHYNHVPQARVIARDCEVEFGGVSTLKTALEELARRGPGKGGDGRVGVVGSFSISQHAMLNDACSDVVDFGRDYARLRRVKSAEERDWMRLGAVLSDMAIEGMEQGLRIGMSEHEIADVTERPYVRYGGGHVIHFAGLTSMADPDRCVPTQYAAMRRVGAGDALSTEISAHFWFHSGQILRTYTVAADPTPLYRDLHDAADAAFDAVIGVLRDGATPAEVIEAASVIEDAGFSIWDDLVHGYGGGYWPPVLGSKSRMNAPLPDMIFEDGMFCVVQPNVITTDGKAGVQTGEMVMVTKDGVERFHDIPRGLRRLDP